MVFLPAYFRNTFQTEGGRKEDLIRRILCAVTLCGIIPALFVLHDEAEVDKLDSVAKTRTHYAPADTALPEEVSFHTPRAALLASSLFLSAAAQAPQQSAQRAALLARAEEQLAAISSTRPHWADRHLLQSSLARLREGDFSDAALAALAASYDDAAFLRYGADWRIRYGFAVWPALSARTQRQIVQEAVWIAHVTPTWRQEIFDLARQSDSDAYVALGQAWHARITGG